MSKSITKQVPRAVLADRSQTGQASTALTTHKPRAVPADRSQSGSSQFNLASNRDKWELSATACRLGMPRIGTGGVVIPVGLSRLCLTLTGSSSPSSPCRGSSPLLAEVGLLELAGGQSPCLGASRSAVSSGVPPFGRVLPLVSGVPRFGRVLPLYTKSI